MNTSKTPTAATVSKLNGERKRSRRFGYALLICLSGAVGAAGIWRADPLLSANDRSRWATVRALVENETYAIDAVIADPQWDTIDKVRHNNHFYSTKPALLPTLVASVCRGVTWLTDQLDGEAPPGENAADYNGWQLAEEPAETVHAVLCVVNLLPWLAALMVLAVLVERYSQRDVTRLFVLAVASVGTILTSFLVTLNNHLIATVSAVFALYPAMRILLDGERRWWYFSAAGFFAALACTNELPAALFGLLLFLLLVWKAPKQTLLFFVLPALIPLAGYFYTNYLATGGWKPFYAYYGTEKYRYVYKGVPSYWMHPTGIDANREPPWLYLLHCTVGHHGIFSLTPVFLFSVWGWLGLWCWKNKRLRPILALGALLTVAVLGFYLTRTQNYNYGGNTAGLRWTFWLIPFWLVALIPVLDRFGHRRWCRALAALFFAVSVFSAVWPLNNPWQQSWLYRLMERAGWIDYRTPLPPSPFSRPVTTWFPTLPPEIPSPAPREVRVSAFGAAGGIVPVWPRGEWVRFEGFDTQGRRITLELTDRGEFPGQSAYRVLTAAWRIDGEVSERLQLVLHQERFEQGYFPAECLGILPGETEKEREHKLRFLRGLPARREYSAGKVVYVFNERLREDAFRCRHAAARVAFLPPTKEAAEKGNLPGSKSHPSLWYRCDSWWTDEVPFGTLQVLFRVSDGKTGEEISSLFLKAVAASRLKKRPPP